MSGFIRKMFQSYKNLNIAIKASMWFAVSSIVQKGIAVISMPIFTRLMSIEQYGEYNIFLTWYNLLMIIVTLNLQGEAFNKGLIEHDTEKDVFTSNQAGLLILLAVGILIIYLPLQSIFNKFLGLSTWLVVLMILEILANALIGIWAARKRFDYEYIKIVLLLLGMSVLNPVIGVFAVMYAPQKAEARIISNAIVPIAIAIVLLIFFAKKGKLFGNAKWWKNTLKLCLPLLPHYLSLVVLNQSDKLMIDYFIGPAEVAIYSVAHSAGLLMTIINSSINNSFVPWLYRKIKGEDEKDARGVTNVLFLLIAVVNLCVVWMAPEVVAIVSTSEYSTAVWCLVPISISVFFFFVYTLFVDVEIYYGAKWLITVASLCAMVLNLVLNYIFIPIYGFLAAGYTTLISYIFTMLMHYIFMRILLKKNNVKVQLFDMRIVFLISITIIGLSIAAMCLYNYIWVRIGVMLLVALLLIVFRKKIVSIFKSLKAEKTVLKNTRDSIACESEVEGNEILEGKDVTNQ